MNNAVNQLVPVEAISRLVRGDARDSSDIDLLIVLPDNGKNLFDAIVQANREISGIAGNAEVHVVSSSYFNKRSHLNASFPGTVLREGVLLYDAGSSDN